MIAVLKGIFDPEQLEVSVEWSWGERRRGQ